MMSLRSQLPVVTRMKTGYGPHPWRKMLSSPCHEPRAVWAIGPQRLVKSSRREHLSHHCYRTEPRSTTSKLFSGGPRPCLVRSLLNFCPAPPLDRHRSLTESQSSADRKHSAISTASVRLPQLVDTAAAGADRPAFNRRRLFVLARRRCLEAWALLHYRAS